MYLVMELIFAFLSESPSSQIKVWDFVDDGNLTAIPILLDSVHCWPQAKLSPDGKCIAFTCRNNLDLSSIELWDIETGHQHQTLAASDRVHFFYGMITFSHSGTRIAHLDGWDYKLSLWDTHTGHLLAVNTIYHADYVCTPQHAILFSPDDAVMAVSSQSWNTLILLNANSGQSLMQFHSCGIPLTFYMSDTGPCILSTHGVVDLPAHLLSHSTLSAIHLNQHSYHVQYDRDHGPQHVWIFNGVQRVCRLPWNYRPCPESSLMIPWQYLGGAQISLRHGLIFGTGEGRIIILDFSKIL